MQPSESINASPLTHKRSMPFTRLGALPFVVGLMRIDDPRYNASSLVWLLLLRRAISLTTFVVSAMGFDRGFLPTHVSRGDCV